MVRFPLLPTLASCLLALTAQAQSTTKAKPVPDKPAAVQPFAPAATTEDHEPVPAPNAAPETGAATPVPATPAAAPSAPATPAKPSPKPAKQ